MSLSILKGVTRADVIAEPFPHIVVRNCLSDEQCRQLLGDFASLETITKGQPYESNQRFSYCAADVADNPDVSARWKEFIAYHSSSAFLQELLEIFAEHLPIEYPDVALFKGPLKNVRAGVRNVQTHDEADVLLDAQICVNTPVVGQASSVRGPHFDLPDKLYAGLFYLRHPDDDSTGGDLQLYTFKSGHAGGFEGQFIGDELVQPVATVPYERNTLVLFLNSERALHGVTPRGVTPYPRYFMNLVGEMRQPLFDSARFQMQRKTSLRDRLAGVKGKLLPQRVA